MIGTIVPNIVLGIVMDIWMSVVSSVLLIILGIGPLYFLTRCAYCSNLKKKLMFEYMDICVFYLMNVIIEWYFHAC